MGFASLYQLPKNNSHCQRCIVRSSGVDEDRFGDAQAGRYQSIVHQDGDILATCLQVLASAYQPDACPQGKVSAMALIIQQYIQCQVGGVLSSHSSLSDDRIEVEYVRSQPDEAVSGKSANPVLRCTIRRDTTEDASKYHFLRDSSDQNTAVGIDDALLSADVLQLLQQYTEALENRFCCPVDIEFGIRSIISQNDKLLGYFHADRLLNRCLGPGRCTSISMSANRARLLSLLDSEIVALMHDLELFFGGYQHFLALAQDTDIDTDTDFDFDADIGPDPKTALTFLNRELPNLGEQGQRLQTSVRKLCEKIVPPWQRSGSCPHNRSISGNGGMTAKACRIFCKN